MAEVGGGISKLFSQCVKWAANGFVRRSVCDLSSPLFVGQLTPNLAGTTMP